MIRALDDLDRRYGGWLRRRPEVGFLLIGAVFVAATAVHAARFEPDRPAEPVQSPPTPAADTDATVDLVGPRPDDDLEEYVQRRFEELRELAARRPDAVAPAIVSFDEYRTPGDAAALLGDTAVAAYAARYRLRASDTPEVGAHEDSLARGQVGVSGDLVAALLPALAREATLARAHAAELAEMAATTDDPDFAETFRRDREALLAAADAAGPDCPCIYAVLVVGTFEELAGLAARAGVRLVDVAPAGSDPGGVVFLAVPPDA